MVPVSFPDALLLSTGRTSNSAIAELPIACTLLPLETNPEVGGGEPTHRRRKLEDMNVRFYQHKPAMSHIIRTEWS